MYSRRSKSFSRALGIGTIVDLCRHNLSELFYTRSQCLEVKKYHLRKRRGVLGIPEQVFGAVSASVFISVPVGKVKPNDSSGFSFQPSAEGFGVAVQLIGRAVAHKFQKQSVIPSV